eukprot:1998523-Amphidinium_carterae.1
MPHRKETFGPAPSPRVASANVGARVLGLANPVHKHWDWPGPAQPGHFNNKIIRDTLNPIFTQPGETRSRLLFQVVMAWTHRNVSIHTGWSHQVFLTCPVATAATFSKWDVDTALPYAHAARDWTSSKASHSLVVTKIEVPPASPLPFLQRDWFVPGNSSILTG